MFLGSFFLVDQSIAQTIGIVEPRFNGCLQQTTIFVNGVGPIAFEYYRNGIIEATDVISTADATGQYISVMHNLPPGLYEVKVTDPNGNSDRQPVNVFLATTVSVGVNRTQNATCSGTPTGEAIINVTSNSSFTVRLYNKNNPTVLIREFNNTQTLTALYAGEYIVEVRDASGCVAYEEIVIEEPLPLLLAEGEDLTVYNPVCDSDQGRVITRISGGNAPEYEFGIYRNGNIYRDNLVTSGGGNIDINDLPIGNYFIRVYTNRAEDNTCYTDYPFDIIYIEKFGVTASPMPISCFGLSDGSVNLVFDGDLTSPFLINLTQENGTVIPFPRQNTETFTIDRLGAGNYRLAVRDAEGCEMYRSFTIVEPAELHIDEEAVLDACFGERNGSIKVNASGGTSPYTFSLSSDFSLEPSQDHSEKTFTGLAAGIYTVYVKDRNGCISQTAEIAVEAPSAQVDLTLVNILHPSCPEAASGEIEVEAFGGWGSPFRYSWVREGSTNVLSSINKLQEIPAGRYQVTVLDKNGCEYVRIFELIDPVSPNIEITPTPVACYGEENGTLLVKLSGSEPYEIIMGDVVHFGTEITFPRLAAGSYTVQVKIAESCYINRTVTVQSPSELLILEDDVLISPVLCYGDNGGGIMGLAIQGGTAPYTYQWQKKNADNDWIDLIDKTDLEINQLIAGEYRLSVIDDRNCSILSSSFILNQPRLFTIDEIDKEDAGCYGAATGSIKVSVDGGTPPYYYSLDNGLTYYPFNNRNEANILSLLAGEYTLKVRDENQCTEVQASSITINEPNEIVLDDLVIENASCAGANDGEITVFVSGGSGSTLTYAWFKQSQNNVVRSTSLKVENLEDGNYFLSVKDPANIDCEKVFGPFTIAAPSSITVSVVPTHIICRDDNSGRLSIEMISGGNLPSGEDYIVEWTGPDGFRSTERDIYDLYAGHYTLSVSDDGNSCHFSQVYEVLQPENKLDINVLNVREPKCFNENNARIEIQPINGIEPYSYSWFKYNEETDRFETIPGVTTRILNQQGNGIYRVKVLDDVNCFVEKDIEVNQPDPITIQLVDKMDISCFNFNDGYINVNVQGGTPPYTYVWSNGQNNKDIFDLRPGNYSLTVFDINGCFSREEDFEIKGVVRPSIIVQSKTDVVCDEEGGAISIELENGLDPADYTIFWKNLQTEQVFGQNQTTVTGLRVGIYQVIVQVSAQCEVSRIIRIEGPESPLELLVAQEDPRCPGLSGAVYLNARGGVAPYSFFIRMENEWRELNGSIIGSLDIGNYDVKVRDDRRCEKEGNLEITQPNPPSYSAEKIKDVSCFGGNDGKISYSVTGGTYQWFRKIPGQNDQPVPASELSALVAGIYYMEITFAANCVEPSEEITIGQPSLLQVNVDKEDPTCFGDTGTGTINILGGNRSKTIQLISLATNIEVGRREDVFENIILFDNLPVGDYKFIVTDQGCGNLEESFTINPVVQPMFSDIEIRNITCRGDNDGSIKVINPTVNVGRSFKVSLNGIDQPSGVFLFENLSPSTYIIQISDNEGCVSERRTVVITEPEGIEFTEIRTINPTCFRGNDGFFRFKPYGGNMEYTAVLTNLFTNESIELNLLQEGGNYEFAGLGRGSYRAILTDGKGCTENYEFTLSEPDGLGVEIITESILCKGGVANARLTLTGGIGPFTVQYRAVGKNWVTETSGIRELLLPNLPAGRYEYKVVDAQVCEEVTNTFDLVDGEKIEVRVQVSPVSCEGSTDGVLEFSAGGSRREGAFNYFFMVNGDRIHGTRLIVPPGIYSVSAGIGDQEANLCYADEITVKVPVVDPMVIRVEASDVSCKGGNDGRISLDITGGNENYRVEWTNNAQGMELTGLRRGNYTAFIYDGRDCFQTVQVTIREPEEELQVLGDLKYETCNLIGETAITLQVRGGTTPYTYLWSNGATTQDINNLGAGKYTVEVTDAKGCRVEKTFDMPAAKSVIEIEAGGRLNLCSLNERGEIRLTVSGGAGGYVYKWKHGPVTPIISNLLPGEYTVEVTDTDGCVATSTTIIQQPSPIRLSISDLSNVSCRGLEDGSIKINITGGVAPYKIHWSTGMVGVTEATHLGPDNYTIRVEDALGCMTSTSVTIREPEMLDFSQVIEDSQCAGENRGAILLTVEGGTAPYSYRWTAAAGNPANGATSRNLRNLSPGVYTVLITDRGGCTTGGSFTVSEPDPLAIRGTYPTMLACNGATDGYINLAVEGGTQPYQLKWSDDPNNNSYNRSNLAAGSYTVEITDENGCKATRNFLIEEPKPLVAQLFSRIDIDCETRAVVGTAWVIVEGGTGEYEVRWHSGEMNVREVNFSKPGDISVYIKDVNGCNIDASRTVNFPPLFADAGFSYTVISIEGEGEVLINDPIQFNDQTTGNVIAWQWDFGDGKGSTEQHPKHVYTSPGKYEVRLNVYDVYGCSTMNTIEVEITNSYRILTPNAFSPNGDGLNDYFVPKYRGISDIEMHIFNTWGDLLYSSYSMEDPGWDGYTKGKMSPNGNYVYKISFTTREGKRNTLSGVFLLIN
ncbi:hypothetical protein EL17_12585 [Anditalea andensis]|uniref:PKD domain-containing protein n=2 Tax=Anditalea andensis TaxID=1048983 RepID=A0A074KW97_9BACT|nr:hypothetical protein EL17_12585 [Anditalea andensis]